MDTDGPYSGAIISQSWNASSFKKFQDCNLKIIPAAKRGLYATVRTLRLRKSNMSESGTCIDYIKLVDANGRFTKNICGEVDNLHPSEVLSQDGGPFVLQIRLDRLRPLPTEDDFLEISIVFTSYEGR